MSHPALTRLRALRYFDAIPALEPHLLDWLLLEDSMTKRFEQQGKRVSVTLIREAFVGQSEVEEASSLLPSDPATGYVRYCFALTASPGLPDVPWYRNPRCADLNRSYNIWVKPRLDVIYLHHRH